MRKSLLGLFLVSVLVLSSAVIISYATDAPLDVNLCYEGDAWGDGRCNHPNDEALQNWYWDAGYYWGLVTNGALTPCGLPEEFGRTCNLGVEGVVTLNVQSPAGPIPITIVVVGANDTNAFDIVATDGTLGLIGNENIVVWRNPINSDLDNNLCNEGNEWGDGRCNTDDEALRNWYWNAGYYLGEVAIGERTICEVPEQFGGTCDDSETVTVTVGSVTITIVLAGTSGTNEHPNAPTIRDHTLNQDNFDVSIDGTGLGLTGTENLEVWGNSANNTITTGSGNDVIHGGDESCSGDLCNSGNTLGDTLNGGAGDDVLNGGNEYCDNTGTTGNGVDSACNLNGTLGDTLNGDDGNDTLNGGDESCVNTGTGRDDGCNRNGTLGDTLNGGDGDDTLNGGSESCDSSGAGGVNTACSRNGVRIGDVLNGDDGDDTLNGGNESCEGAECNRSGTLGDTLNGGGDNDTLVGGNESCDGVNCNRGNSSTIGDTLNGDAGDDSLDGGNESCNGLDCNRGGGTNGDTLNGGTGNDTLTGGDESCTGSQCTNSGSRGDTLIGDAGDDTLTGGGGNDNFDGGSGDETTGDEATDRQPSENCTSVETGCS